MKKQIITFIILIVGFINCHEKKQFLKIDFDTDYKWYYRYYCTTKNLPGYESEPPFVDTLQIVIDKKTEFLDDSVLIRFNNKFIRYWEDGILETPKGYRYNLGNFGTPYLIKYPVKLNQKWEQKFVMGSEKCEITNTDTSLWINNRIFRHCIEISVMRHYEGWVHHIKMYFNKKYGLIYYCDREFEEEVSLIKMEKIEK